MDQRTWDIYYGAIRADERLSLALIAEYGPRRAAEMRYVADWKHRSPSVRSAFAGKTEADERLREYLRA